MDKRTVVYQLFPRMFSKEGTLAAAEERLEEVKQTGINVIYLSPVFCADESPEGQSPRQIKSGMNNPKNPYRMKDFFHVDEEYGSDGDLKSFVKRAHEPGVKVWFDIVYMHCGPNAVFLKAHPDFVKRDENGEIINTEYNFPVINHENEGLREYLLSNVEYLVREFDCDGFRCDVGEAVPLDFWREARARAEKIKRDIAMLNEGMSREYLSVFDLDYNWTLWLKIVDTFVKGESAEELKKTHIELAREYGENSDKFIRYLDNHDTANDSGDDRYEKLLGYEGMQAVLFMLYTLDGIPFIYNGNEFCDKSRHSFSSNRFHGGLHVDRTCNRAGERFEFLKKITRIRNASAALYDGSLEWVENDNGQNVLTYARKAGDEAFLAVINTRNAPQSARVTLSLKAKEIVFAAGCTASEDGEIQAGAYGIMLIKL